MKKLINTLYCSIAILVILFGISFILLCSFGIVTVVCGHGSSMEPTLKDGERYLMIKVNPENIKRGDIIGAVLDDGTRVTKRVIGLPGDKIEIYHHCIFVNEKIAEPYIEEQDWNGSGEYDGIMVLKENQFYLLGDNRNKTWCGIVTGEQITRKVVGK